MHSDSIDTNIIVHGIIKDIPGQRELAHRLLNTEGVIHHLSISAIVESIYVFEKLYHKSRKEIGELMLFFLTRYSDVLIYDHKLVEQTFLMWLSHPKLSFVDCLLSKEAEIKHAEPLYTFDKKLATQSKPAKLLA